MSDTNQVANNIFALTDKEAGDRYKLWKSKDPFPDIRPALLNSADIFDYVNATGMLYPFDPDKLLSASYGVGLQGEVIYWDEKNRKHHDPINKSKELILPPNSIAYVTPELNLRIPYYIALRFNLQIAHVHKGILLGTGPLVDPGYEGKLSIPLHNLTSNNYKLKWSEGFIWIEFTKISDNKCWGNDNGESELQRNGKYKKFPSDKKNRDPDTFIESALKGQDTHFIRSSIPDAIQKSEKKAEEAATSAEEAKDSAQLFTQVGLAGIVVLIVTLILGILQVYGLVQDSTNYVKSTSQDYRIQEARRDKEIQLLENQLESLKQSIYKIQGIILPNKSERDSIIKPKSDLQDNARLNSAQSEKQTVSD